MQILDITITLVSSNDITKHVLLNSSHFMHSSGNGEINCVKLCRYLRIVVFGLLLPTSNSLFLAFTVFSVSTLYVVNTYIYASILNVLHGCLHTISYGVSIIEGMKILLQGHIVIPKAKFYNNS